MSDRGYTDPAGQYVARLAGYDQRLQMLERSHEHEPNLPVGGIIDWPYQQIPPLWMVADGRLLLVAAYSDLFAWSGYFYGGSGAYFALPEARSCMTVAAGQGPGLTSRPLGARGGAETVALAGFHTGPHAHRYDGDVGIPTSGHTHGVTGFSGGHDHGLTGFSGGHDHGVTGNAGGHDHGVTGSSQGLHLHLQGHGWGAYDIVPGETRILGINLESAATTTEGSGLHVHDTAGVNPHLHDSGAGVNPHVHDSGAGVNPHVHDVGAELQDHVHPYQGTTSTDGQGVAHENMPPWVAFYKIIKVLPSTAANTVALTIVERNR